jgi:hypothetical protein
MSWEDQGRQYHAWFGHGTAPAGDAPPQGGTGAIFDPGNVAARIDAIAYSAIANMPGSDRRRANASFDRQRLDQLRTAMTAWMSARSLSRAEFADRFVDPSTHGSAIDKLRTAAEGARTATTHEDLADASADLAGAMRDIGLEKWSRFLGDAAERAETNGPTRGPIVLAQAATPNTAATTAIPGRYVDADPRQWIGQDSVGNGECVALVRATSGADAPQTALWRPGVQVQGNTNIRPGTVIATFDSSGHYDGHAALYLGQDEHGIQVIDQWNIRDSKTRAVIGHHLLSERILHFGESWHEYIDRGEFYHVVE